MAKITRAGADRLRELARVGAEVTLRMRAEIIAIERTFPGAAAASSSAAPVDRGGNHTDGSGPPLRAKPYRLE